MNKIFGQKINSEDGQGLMELIVAIGIIVVGLFSVWALFFSNFTGEQEAETRMLAYNLAREGLEAVKNLRDSNWLAEENNVFTANETLWTWDNGFASSSFYALGQIFSTSSSYVGSTTLISIASPKDSKTILFVDRNGFYNNSIGNKSGFSRFLVFKNICCASSDGFKCDSQTFDYKKIGELCSSGQIKIGVDIVSEVGWQGANRAPRKVLLEDQLFNWR